MSVELRQRAAAVKRLLEAKFGKGKVSVRAEHRGTAYGWINCWITGVPMQQLRSCEPDLIHEIEAAGIELSYRYGDAGEKYPAITFQPERW
jgi:hypothetical protein